MPTDLTDHYYLNSTPIYLPTIIFASIIYHQLIMVDRAGVTTAGATCVILYVETTFLDGGQYFVIYIHLF